MFSFLRRVFSIYLLTTRPLSIDIVLQFSIILFTTVRLFTILTGAEQVLNTVKIGKDCYYLLMPSVSLDCKNHSLCPVLNRQERHWRWDNLIP